MDASRPAPLPTTIIALHGLASSAHWYERLSSRLGQQYRVVAPDQRGHGRTTQAPTGYDWQTLASDVTAFMEALQIDNAAVLGHSWGGNVAINVAARFPRHVSKLVMIDGGFLDGHLLPDASWELFRNRFAPRNVSGNRREFLERISEQLADCWDDDLARIVQTMVYEDGEGQIQDILRPSNHAQVLEAMWGEPPSVTLPQIEVSYTNRAGRPQAGTGRRRVQPHQADHGGGGGPRRTQQPGPLDSRDHPRHRLSQA